MAQELKHVYHDVGVLGEFLHFFSGWSIRGCLNFTFCVCDFADLVPRRMYAGSLSSRAITLRTGRDILNR